MTVGKQSACLPWLCSAVVLLLHFITVCAPLLFLGSEGFITPPGKFIKSRTNENNDTIVINREKASIKENSKYLWSAIDDRANVYDGRSSNGGGASLQQSAESLSSFFLGLVERELGLNETKTYFESTSFDVRRGQSLEDQAKSLERNFSMQIGAYIEAVERLAESVKLVSSYNNTLTVDKCCDVNPETLMYDGQYKTEVRMDMACWSAGSKSKTNLFVPTLLGQGMVKNFIKFPFLRWQYFVSPEGVYVEYPANHQNCKVSSTGPRPVLPKTHPERKIWLIQKSKEDSRVHRFVFLIQLSRNPNPEIIKSMKNIVLMLLRFLDEADEVGILNVDPEDMSSDFLCDQLVSVTPWTRYQILSYLNYIEHRYKSSQQGVPAEVSAEEYVTGEQKKDPFLPLNKSLRMACSNFSSTSFPPAASTIIHLTSETYLNQSLDPMTFNFGCPIFIESYFLRNVGKEEETNYKNQLQRISSKNIWNLQVHSLSRMEPESFAIKVAMKINSKKESWSLSDILSQFFPGETRNSSSGIEFSLPHWNPVSKEPVIVVKKYLFHNGRALGLAAVEIPVVHFTQQITYYVSENECNAKNYAFIIDTNGRVIAHPGLGRPDTSEEVLSPVQIEQVEVRPGFTSLKQRFLSPDEPSSGCQSLRRRKNDWVTYAWSRTENYVVVLVAFGESGSCFPDQEETILRKSFLSPKTDVQHHLLLEKEHCCNNQEFSLTKASLYLSPSAFAKPASSLNPHISIKLSMALMAFLSDSSGLLQNQNKGLKEKVKDHVGVLSNILPTWKYQFKNSEWKEYIQRRFATAGGGTFLLLHPGISVGSGYLPHASAWFRKSVRGNGKLIFSPSRVNSAGTPTSTITRLVKSSVAANPSGVEIPVATLGLTVTLGFFERILQDAVPDCGFGRQRKDKSLFIRCVLLDQEGYVVYHPQLAVALQTSPLIHFTQIEPLSAIDILQSGPNGTAVPLRKETCHKLSETSATLESLQRFYTFSMPPAGIRKLKVGEICNHYHILPIPNTNLFLGKIHDNCSSGAAFCPCSTVDNICLNCLRIELSDCECPCECPREQNFCGTQGFTDLPTHVDPCDFPVDPPASLDGTPCGGNPALMCQRTPCEDILEEEKCVGIHDCEWCETQKDLRSSQCKTFDQCYGYLHGRLNSRGLIVPGDGEIPALSSNSVLIDGRADNEGQITIVPIFGVLAVFLIFLGLVVYCYRHRALHSTSSQPDVDLLPLQGSPMGSVVPQAGSSRSNSDTEGESKPVPVFYVRRHRRPQKQPILPPGSPLGSVFTESDHGYSTMTQNEDSEAGGPLPLGHSSESDPPRTSARSHFTQLPQKCTPRPLITVPVAVEQA